MDGAADEAGAEPAAAHAIVQHHLAAQPERFGPLTQLGVREIDQVLWNATRRKIGKRILRERLESLRRVVFEPILRRPVLEHPIGNRHDVAGVDHAAPAEHPALQDAHRKIVGGPPSPVHVELVVHRRIPLGSLRSHEVAPLFEHDDLVSGLRQQSRSRCTAGARANDADLRNDPVGRRLFGKADDRAGHCVRPCARFIDGPG